MSENRLIHPWSGKPVRALLFDLDGTLVDSSPDIAVALNRVLELDGLPPLSKQVVRSLIGEGVRRLVEKAFQLQNSQLVGYRLDERTERFEALYASAIAVNTKPYLGVDSGLLDLRQRGFKTAIVSNKVQYLTDQLLTALHLAERVDYVCGARENIPKKPAPDMIFHTLQALGVDTAEALFIGDSFADVAAANAAKLPCVLIEGGYTETSIEELGAWKTVVSFQKLWPALAS
jgi:phosphoglycolate phosphatase